MVPVDYLTLAATLVEGVRASSDRVVGKGAADCRCAISRAYYAAYNAAVDFLDMIGFRTSNNHNCHTAVQYALNQSSSKILQKVSGSLNTLHGYRKIADYELKKVAPEQLRNAEMMIELAKDVFSGLADARNDMSLLGVIASAVNKYIETSKTSGLVVKPGNE